MLHEHIKPWINSPKPYENELFSSWVTRVAQSYYISPRELFSKHFTKYRIYKLDVDVIDFDEKFWKLLSHLSQIPMNKLKELQILNLSGKIQERIHTVSRNRWIVPSSGNYDCKTFKSKGLRFCPLCLKEKGYYSKDFKLLYINICIHHQVYLIHRCPNCKGPILPIRISPPKKIFQCFICGYALNSISTEKASKSEVEFAKFANKILKNNLFLHQGHTRKALEYFTVLHILTKTLHRIYPNDIVFSENKITHIRKNLDSPYISGQSPQYLSGIITIANKLLTEGWVNELKYFIRRNKLMYASRLFNKRENVYYRLPNWFTLYLQSL